MSAFTGPLTITHLDTANGRLWKLETPLTFEVDQLGSGRKIVADAGMTTDGASIPRPLWWLLPAWGTYSRSATLHDMLCARLRAGDPHQEAPTWAAAAKRFHEMMIVEGTGQAIRVALYLGVRIWAVRRDKR